MSPDIPSQTDVFEDPDNSPAAAWRRDAARHALDDLFSVARSYRTTREFKELLDFTIRFRLYSPFNAMLLHVQRPGATYVAPASRWRRVYGRRIRTGERPLVILQPMGPVMFVFDVAQTEPDRFGARELPPAVVNPFQVEAGDVEDHLARTIANCARDGIGVQHVEMGSQGAGLIQGVLPGDYIDFQTKGPPKPEYRRIPRQYDLQLNSKHNASTAYATLVHELAHLYCGHLGTPNPDWWPDRRGLNVMEVEFEAESVSYLVCLRLGLRTPAAEYLSGYFQKHDETPQISLDRVLTSAGLIEQMGRRNLLPRKTDGR